MKRNNNNVDEVLKRSLPSAPAEEMDVALQRIAKCVWADAAPNVVPELPPVDFRSSRAFGWRWAPAMAAAAVLVAVIWAWQDRGVYAIVETGNGLLERTSGEKTEIVRAGERIESGETLRTNEAGAGFTLADGSRVEIRSHSEFRLERADDGTRIHLFKGGLIVNAAKQTKGHLYVQTKDVIVSVIGTVFLVNAEEEGSHVAVIEGEVQVQQGKTRKSLLSGDQIATNPQMKPLPVKDELSWSRNAPVHVALLEQSTSSRAGAPKPLAFEVESIRRSRVISPNEGAPLSGGAPECRGVDGRIEVGQSLGAPQGRCIGDHVSLLWLIAAAYDFTDDVAASRIIGGPDWTKDLFGHGFQINAVAPNPGTATREELRQMLRSMLENRFKLKVSFQTKEVEGYILTAAPGGLKLQEASITSSDDPLTHTLRKVAEGTERLTRGRATMKEFVEFLSDLPPLAMGPVIDKVDVKGTFAFDFVYVIPSALSGGNGQRSGGVPGGGLDVGRVYGPFRNALKEQLGIELSTGQIPARFLVIEHVEDPSEN